jgi:hypothetical protein
MGDFHTAKILKIVSMNQFHAKPREVKPSMISN